MAETSILHICRGYYCSCCEQTFRHMDSFAMSTCWNCSDGTNPSCERCVAAGVPFHRFRHPRAMMHRLAAVLPNDGTDQEWRSACGSLTIATAKGVGQGIAVIERYCKRCWPDAPNPQRDEAQTGRQGNGGS